MKTVGNSHHAYRCISKSVTGTDAVSYTHLDVYKRQKPRYTYDIKIINTYNEFYNILETAPFFYIKTNNPRADSIRLHWSPNAGSIVEESIQPGQYRDVQGTRAPNSNMIKVQGGYITRRYPQKTGTYNVQVREIKPQFLDNPCLLYTSHQSIAES